MVHMMVNGFRSFCFVIQGMGNMYAERYTPNREAVTCPKCIAALDVMEAHGIKVELVWELHKPSRHAINGFIVINRSRRVKIPLLEGSKHVPVFSNDSLIRVAHLFLFELQ